MLFINKKLKQIMYCTQSVIQYIKLMNPVLIELNRVLNDIPTVINNLIVTYIYLPYHTCLYSVNFETNETDNIFLIDNIVYIKQNNNSSNIYTKIYTLNETISLSQHFDHSPYVISYSGDARCNIQSFEYDILYSGIRRGMETYYRCYIREKSVNTMLQELSSQNAFRGISCTILYKNELYICHQSYNSHKGDYIYKIDVNTSTCSYITQMTNILCVSKSFIYYHYYDQWKDKYYFTAFNKMTCSSIQIDHKIQRILHATDKYIYGRMYDSNNLLMESITTNRIVDLGICDKIIFDACIFAIINTNGDGISVCVYDLM
jgi:hypothetical protein